MRLAEQGKLGVYLNKCPNCGAYFQCDICPICKTPFPKDIKTQKSQPMELPGWYVVPQMKKRRRIGRVVTTTLIWCVLIAVAILGAARFCWGDDSFVATYQGISTHSAKPLETEPPTELVTFPPDGTINTYFTEDELVDFTLINERPKDLFIRFKQNGACMFEVYLSALGTASYRVPSGIYELNIAAGDAMKWQGEEKHFGWGTVYGKASSTYIPVVGLELTLLNTQSVDGNLHPSNKSDFNK